MVSKVIPLCFSPRIYELWEGAPVGSQDRRCGNICTDCLPSYQLRMKKVGKCEHPETMFTFEDGIVGYRP